MVALHLGFWIVLFVGFWNHWEFAVMVGFILSVANFTNFLAPLITTLLGLLFTLPFEAQTAAGLHLRLFLLMGLIAQVWQALYFLQGVATN